MMAEQGFMQSRLLVLFLIIISSTISHSEKLQSSQANTLLTIQSLLNFPSLLGITPWNKKTDFCNLDPSPTHALVCYQNSLTQLHIVGPKGSPKLPTNFSIDALFTSLAKLPSLKVLTLSSLGLWGSLTRQIAGLSQIEVLNMSSNYLTGGLPKEITSLANLQALILDDNKFSGEINPDLFGSFSVLNVLSLNDNSFNGSLPRSISKLSSLRVLSLANNHFSGNMPDLRGLKDLQEIDVGNNSLGPSFPQTRNKLVKVVLRRNKFRSGIGDVSAYYQLQKLDISLNKFMGPFPMTLLSLPQIKYLSIAQNQLTGLMSRNMSCSDSLVFVDLSSNLLTGDLPDCMVLKSKYLDVNYAGNCLNDVEHVGQQQHANVFCRNQALAAGIGIVKKKNRLRKAVFASCVVGGVVGVTLLFGLAFWVLRHVLKKQKFEEKRSPRVIAEKAASSAGYSNKLVTDSRYIPQTVKLGAIGIPAYRTFSLEELEAATNFFNSTAFMGEGSHGQMYRGQLRDGTLVAIRCLKLKQSYDTEYFMPHIELISQLRHRHLVSAIGHCFECYLEDSTVSRFFVVFEYVSNGTLRNWISAGRARRRFTWSERIAASTGILKGIQYLHTGPGLFSNNIRITDVLIDQNLAAKISSYNLPLLAQDINMICSGASVGSKEICMSVQHQDKADIYDFGVILLEMIIGNPIKSRSELNITRNQVQATLACDSEARRSLVAEEIQSTCSDQSLKTMMDICIRCLKKDPSERPSIEDILWNLQFAAQVQDAWQGGDDSINTTTTPSPPHLPRFRLTYH